MMTLSPAHPAGILISVTSKLVWIILPLAALLVIEESASATLAGGLRYIPHTGIRIGIDITMQLLHELVMTKWCMLPRRCLSEPISSTTQPPDVQVLLSLRIRLEKCHRTA
jgi:hypothetical protein